MAFALILFPMLMAGAALIVLSNRWRPWLLPVTGVAHLILTGIAVIRPPYPATTSSWLALDPPGRLVLLSISVLFCCCAFYTVGYLRYRSERPNRVFCACMLAFLGAMTLVAWSQHLGLIWVAMEATSLSAAPLIYFNNSTRSIEATWKYMLIGSIGIALALLGSFFLAYATLRVGHPIPLTFGRILAHAPQLSKVWLHTGFVLLLIGYGTKMGLAPMHTWKPDAYGEAPGVVGALFAGGITNCAFLAILRVYHVCLAAGERAYTAPLLIFIGLLSMGVAGVFLVGQRDFKRMLAYSSVEHMGILSLGLGVGGLAVFGVMLHMVNNTAAKGVLFLSSGNIHRAYGSKTTDTVHGAMRRLPLSGTLLLAGFLALAGSPPFGPFISEFTIVNAAFHGGRFVTGGLFLAFLLLIFIGMGATVLLVVQGRVPSTAKTTAYRDGWLTGLPPLILMALVLMLGVYFPAPLRTMLHDAASFLQVKP